MRSSVEHLAKVTIPLPTASTVADATAPTPEELVLQMIFRGELDACVKQKAMLESNIKKACSLIIGQCTTLLQGKLKQQTDWETIRIKTQLRW